MFRNSREFWQTLQTLIQALSEGLMQIIIKEERNCSLLILQISTTHCDETTVQPLNNWLLAEIVLKFPII